MMSKDKFEAASRHLSVLAYSHGFSLWQYRMPENHWPALLESSAYWVNVEDMLEPGDIIFVSNKTFAAQVAVLLFDSKQFRIMLKAAL